MNTGTYVQFWLMRLWSLRQKMEKRWMTGQFLKLQPEAVHTTSTYISLANTSHIVTLALKGGGINNATVCLQVGATGFVNSSRDWQRGRAELKRIGLRKVKIWFIPGKLMHTIRSFFKKINPPVQNFSAIDLEETLASDSRASLEAQLVKNPPAIQETPVRSLDWEDSLEKG